MFHLGVTLLLDSLSQGEVLGAALCLLPTPVRAQLDAEIPGVGFPTLSPRTDITQDKELILSVREMQTKALKDWPFFCRGAVIPLPIPLSAPPACSKALTQISPNYGFQQSGLY